MLYQAWALRELAWDTMHIHPETGIALSSTGGRWEWLMPLNPKAVSYETACALCEAAFKQAGRGTYGTLRYAPRQITGEQDAAS